MENEENTKKFEFEEENKETIQEEPIKEEKTKKGKNNKKEKKPKVKLKEKWKALSKKKKILIIIGLVIGLAIICVASFFIIKHFKKAPVKKESVIVENQNYRYEDGTLIFYSKGKREIGKYECKNKNEKKCYVAYYKPDYSIDNTRYIYEDEKEVSFQTPIIKNKYAFIFDNAKKTDEEIKIYDFKNKKEIDTCTEIKKANDDYNFIIKDKDGKYGVISLKEEYTKLIDFNYDYLGHYDNAEINNFIVQKDDKYYLIDLDENEVSTPAKRSIASFNSNYIISKNDSTYNLYDYKGNKVIDENYDFITTIENYLILVKNGALDIYDKDRKLLNGEPIKLINNYYNKTYIYDKKDKVLKILQSFDLTAEENTLTINVYKEEDVEKTYTINLLESLVNAKIDYISYIDGKLYFYSNKEKTNLLGYYTCKNKNVISSADSTLNNCFLAKENSERASYLPIINNRYVFINDTLDNGKPSIYLYDLQNKKSLSNYLNVYLGIDSEDSFYSSESLNVVALSAKKNKYGIINISSNDVKSILEFANEKIEILNDNYLVNKATGTYAVYNKLGTSLTGEFADLIDEYNSDLNLVKTVKNNKYKVYTNDGKEITKKYYEYVELFKKYVVGIDSKKLDVYDFDGNYYCDACYDIQIYKDFNNAYAIDDEKIVIFNDGEQEIIPFKGEE